MANNRSTKIKELWGDLLVHQQCWSSWVVYVRANSANVMCFSHLHQEFSVGQNTVLVRERLPEVIERGHAVSANRDQDNMKTTAAVVLTLSTVSIFKAFQSLTYLHGKQLRWSLAPN